MIEKLGKAEGIVCVAIFFFGVLVAMRGFGLLDGPQFVSAFQIHVGAFFGGSALAAFRDFKKGA